MKFYTGISGKSPSKFELQFSSRTSIRLLYSNLIEIFAACLHPQTTLFSKFLFLSCNVQGHSDVILTVSRSYYYQVQLRYKHPVAAFRIVQILYSIVLYIQILYCNCIPIVQIFQIVFCREELRLLIYWGRDNWGGMDIWSEKERKTVCPSVESSML